MAFAFDQRSCGSQHTPTNTKMPLDTEPMMPETNLGTGVGGPTKVRGPVSPWGEATPGTISPPIGGGGGGGGSAGCSTCRIPYYSG